MPRMRALVVASSLVVLAGACSGGDGGGPPVLLVGTPSGVATVDTASGTVGTPVPRAVASPDGRLLVRADLVGTRTQIRAVDLGRDDDRWVTTVEGTFEPRAVAADGARVALTAPPAAAEPGELAPGRSSTELIVAGQDAASERYEIEANIEPEAFSLDGTALFVVQFLPARQPTSYQVRRFDLASGELGDVYSADADLQQAMRGTARTQVWDPDGSRLYTLYTQEVGAETVAFVHVLDLEEQWAHCILLPDGFTPSAAGLALADGADDLYVADAAGGVVAAIDTEALAVVEEATLRPAPNAYTSPVAVGGGEVYVGSGADVLVLDRSSLQQRGSLRPVADVIGIQLAPEPGELFVASPGAVLRVDLADGEVLERTLADQTIGSFMSLGQRSIPTYAGVQCAC